MTNPDRILATGGGGRLGRALGSVGAIALSRDALDITDIGSIARALDKHSPVLVINAAAYTNVEGAEENRDAAFAVNAGGAGNVARSCADRNIPLIHISTDYVFGDGHPSRPVNETTPTNPLSIYGESKLAGEQAVIDAGGQATIVRVSWLFDGSADTFIDKMLKIASTRDKMMLVDDATGRPTSVDDLASSLLKLAGMILEGKETPKLLHMGPPAAATRYAWAADIFQMSAKRGGPSPILERCTSDAFPTKVRHPLGVVLDVAKAEALIGAMPDWRNATARSVEKRLAQISGN